MGNYCPRDVAGKQGPSVERAKIFLGTMAVWKQLFQIHTGHVLSSGLNRVPMERTRPSGREMAGWQASSKGKGTCCPAW